MLLCLRLFFCVRENTLGKVAWPAACPAPHYMLRSTGAVDQPTYEHGFDGFARRMKIREEGIRSDLPLGTSQGGKPETESDQASQATRQGQDDEVERGEGGGERRTASETVCLDRWKGSREMGRRPPFNESISLL